MTTLTVLLIAEPPTAVLSIQGLPASTARVEVVRTWRGVTQRVRGDSTLGITTLLTDWDYPVALPDDPELVAYTVTPYDATGAAVVGGGATATSPPARVGHAEAWVADPHDPAAGVRVALLGDGEQQAESPVSVVQPLRGLPIALDRPRSTRGREWTLLTSAESAEQVDAILGVGRAATSGAGVVLLRADASCIEHPTGTLYVTAPRVARVRPLGHDGDVVYTWTGLETRGPAAPSATPRRSYTDDRLDHSTYQQSRAAQPTYRDRALGPL